MAKENVYHSQPDVERLEDYIPGGYHPTIIGDTFSNGRYTVIHKLGFGGYSTIWLARDQQHGRYVSLKILTARASLESHEGEIITLLMNSDLYHTGKQFIPPLLGQFSFHGPNGYHSCLVGELAGSTVAKSKEDSPNYMFPADAARSIAAQLILGLSYLHAKGICHGDLYLRNILLRTSNFDDLSIPKLYERFGNPRKVTIRRVDGSPSQPHAPLHAIPPMGLYTPANELYDPEIIISDYGTSFLVAQTPSPTLYTPPLYSPPEDLFNEPISHPTAADIWTLGVNLYDVLGERPLFETLSWDRDEIFGEIIDTLGKPPLRWWNSWLDRPQFSKEDGSRIDGFDSINPPAFRRLPRRLWDMGRGETEQTCEWDVAGGELRALEDLLRAMMAFEPTERPTVDQILKSEYVVKWAMPAWERQKARKRAHSTGEKD
ncbi:kinase domain-containing protein [Penicillium angulare]|uniref:non-specific serine/threonine protein kinase n=1 Tax=Penicillium angulare TaxID=116970 RepID=A0A9W9FZP1_9EURO|nr:kinase domain-containing protein [Penicillium angulare]